MGTEPVSPDAEVTSAPCPRARLEWLVLIALFLVIGAVGHDPWGKKEEPYLFGIIYSFYTDHHWLVPMDAGVPFMEKPPLYSWTGLIFCDLFGRFMPLYDAARLASVFYMGLATFFLWKTARVLFGDHAQRRAMAWISVALFLGTYGVAHWAHEMITDTALVAGTCIALYGMGLLAREPQHYRRAGAWLGLGVGVAFMAKGLLMPGVLLVAGLALLALVPPLRRPASGRGVLIALLVAAPFILVWPTLLYCESPALFSEWLWDNNIGRFFGFSVEKLGARNDRLHLLAALPMAAFPLLPLALTEMLLGRRDWRRPEYVLPLGIFIAGLLVLLVSASGRPPYFLPLLPGLSLLAAPALMRAGPRLLAAWNALARFGFSAAAVGLWLIWWNLMHTPEQQPWPWLARRFDTLYPSDFAFTGDMRTPCAFALLVTLFWLANFRVPGRTPLATARIWFAGVALVWCTAYTLLLPWINETRSYRGAIMQMQEFVDHSPYAGGCIANYGLGENMAPMVEYFLNRRAPLPVMEPANATCPLLLSFALKEAPAEIDPRWRMVWHGTRLRDIKTYELRLYARAP